MGNINIDMLVNDSTGTQIKDAFKAAGTELDEFPPPGASNPGVYNGVQIVDAFKAWNKANPGKIDMNLVSTCMKGSQLRDLFKIMLGGVPAPAAIIPPVAAPVAAPITGAIHDVADPKAWVWAPRGSVPPVFSATAPTPTPSVADPTRQASFAVGGGYLTGWWNGTNWVAGIHS